MTPLPPARRVPRLARWLLWRALPDEAREHVVGDLDEEYLRYRLPAGRLRATAWYWSQALRSTLQTRAPETIMSTTPSSLAARLASTAAAIPADIRFAVRMLRRAPGYAAAALMTFAIGVGAASAIFSTVNDVLLRPLPYAEPDRLAVLWESNEERGWHRVEAAPANVEDWRRRATTLDDIAYVNPFPQSLALMAGGSPISVDVGQVSGNFFAVLGVPPAAGRLFRDEETFEPGLAMLSYDVWRNRFGADPALIGRSVQLDGESYQVVGVMSRDFRYPLGEIDVWTTPAWMDGRQESIWWRQAHVIRPVARLAPGATFAQASAELETISAALEREYPDTNTEMVGGVAPMQEFLAGDRRRTLLLLLGAVGLLQLIACANVANLMLGRAAGRGRELAVRAALGAERSRLVRQTLTESLVLAAGGTLLGLGLGMAGLQFVASLAPPEVGNLVMTLDWRVALFAAGLCVASAVLAGALPAWRHARVDATRHLDGDARSGTAARGHLVAANTFVAAEIALAVLLVAAAGLMVRSLDQLRRVDPGVDTESVLTFRVRPSTGAFPTDGHRAMFGIQFEQTLERLPGVVHAGLGRGVPMTGYGWTSDFTVSHWAADRYGVDVKHREVTSGYFKALGVPLLEGRLFDDRDLRPDAPVPVVVNVAFVDRYFPDESPLGREVIFDRVATDSSYRYPIVGVVGNERMELLAEPEPEIISHIRGDVPGTFTFVVKTTLPPLSLVPQVRAALDDVDPTTPLLDVRSMDAVMSEARAGERFLMTLFGLFAVSALLLAAVGVYGVANQAARARTREVGIRLALGASGGSVVRQLVGRGARAAGAGLAVGLAGALLAGPVLRAWLFGVDPRDPLTIVSVVLIIGVVALAATVLPTWRATRVDPASVLRAGGIRGGA